MPVFKSSYFVAVEKREVGRLSDFADSYTEPATSEFYHKFLMIMNSVWDQSGP